MEAVERILEVKKKDITGMKRSANRIENCESLAVAEHLGESATVVL